MPVFILFYGKGAIFRGLGLSQAHRYQDLISIFEQTFFSRYNTRLVKGDDEPIYLPADDSVDYHRIVFAHGFFASALHEISHWLVAGKSRRLLEDFGYWYLPDGRSAQQQAEFEAVEVKPQAIEWALCVAAGFKFNVSCDNLSGAQPDRFAFEQKVYQRVKTLLEQGFNERTERMLKALAEFYHTPYPLTLKQFKSSVGVDEQLTGAAC